MASTMTPALPPSSSTTCFLPARAFMRQPTAGEPVNESSLKRSSVDQAVAQLAGHGQDGDGALRQAGVVDDLGDREHRERVADGGLSTIEQPAAMAGATLWAARLSGKLKGLMPATGPTGKRRVMPSRPTWAGPRSSGMVSPTRRSASSAARRKVSAPRSTSARASRMGLPDSRAMSLGELVAPRRDARARWSRSARLRSKAGRRRMASKPRSAASTASSYCSARGEVGRRRRAGPGAPGRRPRGGRARSPSGRPGRWGAASVTRGQAGVGIVHGSAHRSRVGRARSRRPAASGHSG